MKTEKLGLIGRTKIWKGTPDNPEAELIGSYEKDLLEDGSFENAIFPGSGTTTPTGLKSYLAECMSSGVNFSIATLFDAHTNGAGENNADGIVVMPELGNYADASGTAWTMITTVMSTTTPFARKWKGTATVSAGPVQWSAAAIGHGWQSAPDPLVQDFDCTYATQSFTTVTLGVGESLTIEWELSLV